MQRLILDQRELKLTYNNQCLLIKTKDKSLQSIPLTRIEQIICMHNVELTSQLLGQLNNQNIDFIILNQRHIKNSVVVYGNQQKQVDRRCRQYQWQHNASLRLPIAIRICQQKLHSSRHWVTQMNHHKTIDESLTAAANKLLTWQGDEDQLRGLEGAAQRQLFDFWRQQLPEWLGFVKRQRRPPPDPVNGLLSLTYTLVYQLAIRQCLSRALDSQLGFYHRPCFGRHSLACDIMEAVRPAIEYWVVTLFTQKKLDLRHFTPLNKSQNGCFLGKQGRELYYPLLSEQLPEWERQLDAEAQYIAQQLDRSDSIEQGNN